MTLSVLDVQRALEARGIDEVRWVRRWDGKIQLEALHHNGMTAAKVKHSQPDVAWRRLLDAIDASVELPDFSALHETETVPAHEEDGHG